MDGAGTRKRGRTWGLGVLVPAATAAVVLVDLALRFLPLERVAFRAWEPLRADAPGNFQFAPGRRSVKERTYGDLAALANRRDLRRYRPETFTTDALGHRNDPRFLEAGPPDAILIGDSFGAGAGVSDDETLAVQLTRETGLRVYNAAGDRARPGRVRDLAARTGMKGGLVFQEVSVLYPNVPGGGDPPRSRMMPLRWRPFDRFMDLSRLRIGVQALLKVVQDDRVLPNPYAGEAVPLRLAGGDVMLFRPDDLREDLPRRVTPAEVRAWREQADAFAAAGFRLVVVIVPTKHAVYRPLIPDDPLPAGAELAFVTDLGLRLREAGIDVIDVSGPLREAAARAYSEGGFVYRPDDTHWNAEGVGVAARAIAAALRGGR